MKRPIATGTRVTDSRLAAPMAKVLVKASGLNSRPSWPSSVNTGRNETVMITNEKKRAGPTSRADFTTTAQRSSLVSADASRWAPSAPAPAFAATARSKCLCMFSIITIAPSIIAPMAIAIPPSDMMSAPTPTQRMAMNAIRMPTGRVTSATSAERAWSRNATQTRPTMTLSSSSFSRSVAMARWIRSLRS